MPINSRLISYYHVRIWFALKKKIRSKHTRELLGCEIDFFKKHLENKFIEGMTWNNYGKWHVDHIKPCSSFNLSKEKELLECFNYKNLQPLWAKDNIIKGSKYE